MLFCAFLLVTGLALTCASDPMSKSLSCTQPPSRTNFLANVSMFVSPLFLCSSFAAEPELARAKDLPSILHTRALLPSSSSRLFWPAAPASFPHLSGRHISCPLLLALQTARCAHCGHLMSMSRVSHMTAHASPLTCLHVSHLSPNVFPSKPVSRSLPPSSQADTFRPSKAWSWWEDPPNFQIVYLLEHGERHRLLLACCCCHRPPQIQPFCGREANDLPSPCSGKSQTRPRQLPHTSPPV